MTIPKVDVFEMREGYELRWIIDGDAAGSIGELDLPDEMPTPEADQEMREIWLAHKAAEPFASETRPHSGFTYESASKANAALRAVRAAFRADLAAQQGTPWPAWAVTAQAAGWKPPRGWKPGGKS